MDSSNLFVLERKSIAGITSPAIDTFIVSGFSSIDSCIEFYRNIAGFDSRTRVSTLENYLSKNKVPRFRDDTGCAGIIQKSGDTFNQFKLTPLSSYLILHDITIINIIEGYKGSSHELIYSPHEMDDIRNVNLEIKRVLMLGKEYIGSYIYRTESRLSGKLEDFINNTRGMSSDAHFLVVYQNPTIRTVIDTENRLFDTNHKSVVSEENDMLFEININDKQIGFDLIDTQCMQIRFK